jgi:hypothetical protein
VDPLHFHPSTPETYRAFFLARNGRVLGMVPLEAGTEEEAQTLARELADEDEIVELWAGLRTVARFEHVGVTARTC